MTIFSIHVTDQKSSSVTTDESRFADLPGRGPARKGTRRLEIGVPICFFASAITQKIPHPRYGVSHNTALFRPFWALLTLWYTAGQLFEGSDSH